MAKHTISVGPLGSIAVFDPTTTPVFAVKKQGGGTSAYANAILQANADGEFEPTTAPAASIPNGDKGDITTSGSGATWTIDNDAVTNAKAANMAQSTIKGRAAGAGTGDPTDLTVTQAQIVLGIMDFGTEPLVAGSVTVSSAAVTADSLIFLTPQNSSGTPGAVYVSARNAGVDFTITSTDGADTRSVAWMIFEP